MMLPVRIDLARITHTFTFILQFIAVLAPGLALVTGLFVAEEDLATAFFSTQLVGYYMKLFLVALASYVLGLVFWFNP